MSAPVLKIEDLVVRFRTDLGELTAVDGVSYEVAAGETLCVVGESGCGKTVTVKAALRILPEPPARIAGGRVLLGGEDLLQLPERKMRAVRGNRVAMIFQDPMTALNPVYTVGAQIEEAIALHQDLDKAQRRALAAKMLAEVGIPDPERNLAAYPHQLSGGMRQRVMIAMALSCEPEVLLADEPTTALDVTIQAQILRLMKRLQREHQTALVLITHDLGVVAEVADRVVVMYAGRVVEQGTVREIFHAPAHPYTKALLRSVPKLSAEHTHGGRFETIEGTVPSLAELPAGCVFQDRCPKVQARCRGGAPELEQWAEGRAVRCYFPEEAS